MNRSLSKASRLALKPILALAMVTALLASFMLDSVPAYAQDNDIGGTIPGEFCILGLVIDHEEKPLSGWEVTITNNGASATVTSAEEDNDDDLKKGQFKVEELFITNAMTVTVPVTTGTYTATLTMMEGYEAVTPEQFTFPIRANMKDCVKIRFKVKLVRIVEVYKIDRFHQPLEDWTILAKPGEGNVFAEPVEATTNVSGTATFTLTKGNWVFLERPPNKDDAFRPIVPPTGKAELEVTSDQDFDVPYVLVFKNELLNGCIEVIKYGVVPPTMQNGMTITPTNGFINPIPMTDGLFGYPVAGWGFKLLRTDYSLVDIKYTDASGMVTFDNLPFGPYIVVEEDRVGWNELNERSIEVNVTQAGDCRILQFENEQDDSGFVIEGRKLDANGHYGLADWTIKIKPLDKGGYDVITETTTDGLGEYRFEFPDNDYRIPGAKFEICEEIEDGWEPLTPTCQVVTLPEKPTAHPVRAKDFINQQIGHVEHKKPVPQKPGKDGGKGDPGYCSDYHVVKQGEGLFSVGAAYSVSPQAMLDANPTVRDNANYWVYVGQRLCIP